MSPEEENYFNNALIEIEERAPAPAKIESQTPKIISRKQVKSSDEVIEIMNNAGHEFRLKTINDEVECNGERLTDVAEAEIRLFLRDMGISSGKQFVGDCILKAANRNKYNPILEYLESCQYDGHDYIREVANHFYCAGMPIEYPDGNSESPFYVYFKRWLIGAAAHVYDGAQNRMLVIVGGQGIGKSSAASWLCSGIPEYFIEASIYGNDKDNDINAINNFVWEVSELDATTRKADVSALKAFISRQVVTVRAPYGRNAIKKFSLANFIGTVNRGSGFLADETGNRRFMCVEVMSIDFEYTNIDINRLWGQAVYLFKSGESGELQGVEKDYQSDENKKFEYDDPFDGWIADNFAYTGNDDHFLKTSEIVDHLLRKNVPVNGNMRSIGRAISKSMQKVFEITGASTGKRRGYKKIIAI